MQGIRTIRCNLSRFAILARTHLNLSHFEPTHFANPTVERTLSSKISIALFSLSTSRPETPITPKNLKGPEECSSDNEDNGSDMDNDDDDVRGLNLIDDGLIQDAKTIVSILQESSDNRVEMKNKIEQCVVKVSQDLVLEVLSRVRNDWEAAFTFFLWASRQPGYAHSVREYHSMISILGKMRKFDTAWALIDEMRGVKTGVSLVTPQTLLIMIRKYCAVHDVGRAINTFYAYKRFKFDMEIDEFQSLLSALCRYKNVQDAEQLMYCNKAVFPLNLKSFNIVLNGWCNLIGSPREAERVWRDMSKRGIRFDVVSYASMLSCYSKAGSLYRVLRLYKRMQEMGIEPDRKVYNAVIHALAKGRLVNEAFNLMKTMEEKGVVPTIVTYNSLIKPLCRAKKVDEAKDVFDDMLKRSISPTIRTYHAFFRILRTGEEVFALLEKMRKMGCQPINDTYIMLIRKFCRWRQLENVFKLWDEMKENGISPDRSSYIVLIHGLFLNGELDAAHKYYTEMKERQLLPEPKIDEMLQTWLSNKQMAEGQTTESRTNQLDCSQSCEQTRDIPKRSHERNFLRLAETRKVVRERGFSFWEP